MASSLKPITDRRDSCGTASDTGTSCHGDGPPTGCEGRIACISTGGGGSAATNSGSSRKPTLDDTEVDILLHKAGITDRPDDDTECRVGQCRMRCVERLATIGTFTCMCCVLATLTGALTAGYVNSVITTIEKRFEIGSSFSGLIAASVEIGGVLSAIVVSYLGSRRHIPNWIGFGAIVTSVGTLLFTVPHMMAPAYTVTGGLNSTRASDNVCRARRRFNDLYSEALVGSEETCLSRESGQPNYVLTLVIAQLLIGIGGSPLYTLGTAYIDNHIAKRKAPSYIAFIYAFGVFGPLLGFALGALMLQYYVDLLSFDTADLNLTSSNPRWVGAWWAGFIFIGGLFFVVSLPFFGFPRLLVREIRELIREDPSRLDVLAVDQSDHGTVGGGSTLSTTDGAAAAYGKNIKDFPKAVWHLVTNPVYIVTCFGICCEVSVVSGFVVFLPKYLETEFGASKSLANLLTGGSAIPGAVVGILMGGYCLRHFQLTRRGAIQFTLMLNAIAVMGFGVFFSLGCDNIKMAGITVPYPHNSSSGGEATRSPVFLSPSEINLTSPCNAGCNCNSNSLEPVCGANMVAYFSPCHAGCARHHVGAAGLAHTLNYTNCACVAQDIGRQFEAGVSVTVVAASSGLCRGECATLLPFMIMLFFMTFVIAGTQMPLLMVTIRSVNEEEKAFALGVQFVMLRLFAYIPAPIMYGNIIDSTCIFWSEQCGYHGNCLLYDLVFLRYKYVGISFALKILAAIFYVSIWMLLRRQDCCDIHLVSTSSTSRHQSQTHQVVGISIVTTNASPAVAPDESKPCIQQQQQLSVKGSSDAGGTESQPYIQLPLRSSPATNAEQFTACASPSHSESIM